MFTNYENAKVVITGGANGIGKTLALGFAKRGSDVAIIDIHGDEAEAVAKEIRGMGRKSFAMQADVSVLDECKAILDKTMAEFGRCDVLVNNAGVSALSDVEHIPEKDIRWVYETNVYSHWFMMQNFLPQMRSQKSHCQIINVCSIAGLISMNGAPAYFSSKHAAVALSECVYKQLKSDKADIDVSIFCPGYINTEMHLTDRHRPERFAIHDDEPYYHTEEYAKFVAFNKYLLENGADVNVAVETIFKALEKEQFYILDTPKYERLLCEQGVFEAEKIRPVDYYTLEEKIGKKFLLYFRLALLCWILIANAILHIIGFSYGWLIFISNIMLFTLEGDVKERFLTVEIGGLVGLVLTVLAMLAISALTPIVGDLFGLLIPLAAVLALLILGHPYAPKVLNNVGFAYLTCACIDTASFASNIGLFILAFVVGSLVFNGVCVLLMKPMKALAVKSVTKAASNA